ncbi:hypothetical protein [Acinetobacter bouvetii]|uniref:hypothetical protein n=1 Tax=Acinetobacter bouvetii TaxID=202951 RepID=UPI003A5986DB
MISREMLVSMGHPLRSNYLLIASPIRLSRMPVQYVNAPPYLGEDTAKILNRFVSEDKWKALKHKTSFSNAKIKGTLCAF